MQGGQETELACLSVSRSVPHSRSLSFLLKTPQEHRGRESWNALQRRSVESTTVERDGLYPLFSSVTLVCGPLV